MKLFFSPLVLVVAAGGISVGPAAARDRAPAGLYDSYTGFALPAAPVLPAREVHPSLWFKAADVSMLKDRYFLNEYAIRLLLLIGQMANLNPSPPLSPASSNPTDAIHKYYGAMSIAARAHAVLFLLAKDDASHATHRQRAEELLLRAYDGPIYELDSKVQGSPVDEIYRGSWLQNYAHAYDCIQPTLTPEVDRQIRARLAREAQCVYENLYVWTPGSPHNHLSKPAWGLGSMALTLSDDPRAKAWLGRALEASNRNTRYFFSGDGLYREGSHYLIFSLTNFVPFLYHYRNVSGVDGFAAFQPVFEAMIETRNSGGWLPNIEDSYFRPTPTHLVAAAYRGKSTKLHSTAPLSELLAWSSIECALDSFRRGRADGSFNYTGASWDYPLEIDELLTHDPTIHRTAPDVSPNVFLQGGQTVFRSSWDPTTVAGQRYLLFHGVAVADNHNHDDQLSFIIQAEGQLMCSDSGYSRGTYTGAERTAWYNTAAAHNTLTFDGQPAGDVSTGETPASVFRVEEPGLVGEEKSTTFGQKAAWSRAILWIAGDYYAVIDRVVSPKPGEVKSYLHGGRAALTTAGAERIWTYADDRYGSAARLRTWIAAPGAVTEVKQGELTYLKGDYAAFPYLELTASNFTAPWITLLKPAAIGASDDFKVQDRSAGALTALLVTASDHRTLIAARAKGSLPIALDDVETDASLVVVRRDPAGKILNHLVRDATYLRVGGQTIPP